MLNIISYILKYQAFLTKIPSYVHLNPIIGDNLYRIKCVDIDGSAKFTNIETVRFSENNEVLISVYPVPASNEVQVKIVGMKEEPHFQLLNVEAKTIECIALSGNNGFYKLNTSSLSAGKYFLKFIFTNVVPQTKSILVVH